MTEPEGRKFTLQETVEGLISVRWTPGARIEEADAWQMIARIQRRFEPEETYLLINLSAVVSASRSAMTVFSSGLHVQMFAAVGSSPVEQMLVGFYQRVYQPAYPIGYFSTISGARDWLVGGRDLRRSTTFMTPAGVPMLV